ncbi:MAG: hypothetical protein VXW87_02635 [Pseudomonadota bacterium]|nr:hypothetical protein [Pseudomonadota bacterium]
MKALIGRLLPFRHSMTDIIQFANAVYYDDLSSVGCLNHMAQNYHAQSLPTSTALKMQIFKEKRYPRYQVVAIRGTVAASDYFLDNLQHTLVGDGISDYQVDAFNSLSSFFHEDDSGLPVILTGHSMGGKISEILLAQLYISYIKSDVTEKVKHQRNLARVIAIYAYDGPGAFPLLDNYFKHEFGDGYHAVLDDFLIFRESKVYDVVGHPNSVNMCHKHTGHVYYLPNYGSQKHINLEEKVLGDFTKDLVAKHSVEEMMYALRKGEQVIKVEHWGGVSTIEQGSSIRKLNNFFCSYHEHLETQAQEDPTWKNYAAAGMTKLIFGAITWSKITSDHPLVHAAKQADKEINNPPIIKRIGKALRRFTRVV